MYLLLFNSIPPTKINKPLIGRNELSERPWHHRRQFSHGWPNGSQIGRSHTQFFCCCFSSLSLLSLPLIFNQIKVHICFHSLHSFLKQQQGLERHWTRDIKFTGKQQWYYLSLSPTPQSLGWTTLSCGVRFRSTILPASSPMVMSPLGKLALSVWGWLSMECHPSDTFVGFHEHLSLSIAKWVSDGL